MTTELKILLIWLIAIGIITIIPIIFNSILLALYKSKKYVLCLKLLIFYRLLPTKRNAEFADTMEGLILVNQREYTKAVLFFDKIKSDGLQAWKYYWLTLISIKLENGKNIEKFHNLFSSSSKNVRIKGYIYDQMADMLIILLKNDIPSSLKFSQLKTHINSPTELKMYESILFGGDIDRGSKND